MNWITINIQWQKDFQRDKILQVKVERGAKTLSMRVTFKLVLRVSKELQVVRGKGQKLRRGLTTLLNLKEK